MNTNKLLKLGAFKSYEELAESRKTLRQRIKQIMERYVDETEDLAVDDMAELFFEFHKEMTLEVIGEDEGWADFVEPYSSFGNSHDQDLLKQAKEIELTCRTKVRAEQRQRLDSQLKSLEGGQSE